MPAVAALVGTFFVDDIALEVERTYYPADPVGSPPPTLRAASALLSQVSGLIQARELPRLLDHLDPAIVSLARLEPQLQRLLALLSPVTECLRTNAVPT